MDPGFRVIVVGSGHAGAEAAWAAANLLPESAFGPGSVALVTIDPGKTGVMSCNPAIGGLAKGQIVREIDALGGLMGLVADETGIQFKVLNTSKGPAVHGPRCQSDKHAYAGAIRRRLHGRREISVIAAPAEDILVSGEGADRLVTGLRVGAARDQARASVERLADEFALPVIVPERTLDLRADAVVITTGTFMRGLMHTGSTRTPGGREGEAATTALSRCLERLGFEMGRLKTGTPPRLRRATIDWDALEPALGDDEPVPFSDLTDRARFPATPQIECRSTQTAPEAHRHIRANLHRAPMFSGQINSAGPRYCPSIEDKVHRFAQRESHNVFLEPESHSDDAVYCNGIATSLPIDVQERIVRTMPGCERAEVLVWGYAVEYDTVRPHQITTTAETKDVAGLFLAGQINGTSGYEEAGGQGLIAGANAALRALGFEPWSLGRDEAYIGVMMDDLVTKTPREPYRMFTSRAEHRLSLRADNSADRLTPIAERVGLLSTTDAGRERSSRYRARAQRLMELGEVASRRGGGGDTPAVLARRAEEHVALFTQHLRDAGASDDQLSGPEVLTLFSNLRYAPYIRRSEVEMRRHAEHERARVPDALTAAHLAPMRTEAQEAILRFRPATFGQASRLEGVTPADLTLLMVLVERCKREGLAGAAADRSS